MASVVVGASTYLYIIAKTIRGTGEGLSFATFFLWATITWIVGGSIFRQSGIAAAAVPFIYATGASIVTIVLFHKKRMGWGWFESLIAALVAVCMYLYFTQPFWALVLSVIAAGIAALPFILVSWKQPATSEVVGNTGFLVANILSCIAAENWLLENRLYPIVNIAVCALLVVPWVKHKAVEGFRKLSERTMGSTVKV